MYIFSVIHVRALLMSFLVISTLRLNIHRKQRLVNANSTWYPISMGLSRLVERNQALTEPSDWSSSSKMIAGDSNN